MIFSIHTQTNVLGYQIIPIDDWEERDVERGKGGVGYKTKNEVTHSVFFLKWIYVSFKT